MTHEITGSNAWRPTITSPATGDGVNQAAWDTPNQDIADCLVYLKDKLQVEAQHVSDDTIATTVAAYQIITGDTNWHDFDASGVGGTTAAAITLVQDVKAGDIIEVQAHFGCAGDGTYDGVFRAIAVYNSSDHEVGGSGSFQSGALTYVTNHNCSGRHVMLSDESGVVIKLQGKVSNASGALVIENTSVYLAVTVYRPQP